MRFPIIVADCPWAYNQRCTHSDTKFGGGASGTYDLMNDQNLIDMGPLVQCVSEKDSLLFMWATMPRLDLALEVMKSWGFKYKTTAFVWVKTNKDGSPAYGPGYYTASNAEIVLLGTREKGKILSPKKKMVNSVILSPRTKHSAKPEEIQDRIELMYPGMNYLEMFARRERENWTCLGNEIGDKLDIRESLPLIARA